MPDRREEGLCPKPLRFGKHRRRPGRRARLGPGCRVIKAQVIYGVEDEMALTLEDFMSRRTDLLHFNGDPGFAVVAAKLMGKALGWSRARRKAEIRTYREKVRQMFHFKSAL